LEFSDVKDLETKSTRISYRRIIIISRVHYVEDAKKVFLKQYLREKVYQNQYYFDRHKRKQQNKKRIKVNDINWYGWSVFVYFCWFHSSVFK